MLKPKVIATLSPEDLERFNAVGLRATALEKNPTAYSQAETESIIMAHRRCMKDLLIRYEVDMDREWEFDIYSGHVMYKED